VDFNSNPVGKISTVAEIMTVFSRISADIFDNISAVHEIRSRNTVDEINVTQPRVGAICISFDYDKNTNTCKI
jgi:hypothetical protein